MAEQLDMFAPKPEPKRKTKKAAPQPECPLHAAGYICTDCPSGPDTDHSGFPHPSLCKGLVPLRVCRFCRQPQLREHWDAERGGCSHDGCSQLYGDL